MNSFTELKVWKTGIALLQQVYSLTSIFPTSERFELVKQMRRASFSILANIAEGFSKRASADKANKYTIARGECSEVEAFLLGSIALKFLSEIDAEPALSLAKETGKMLTGLIQAQLRRDIPTPYSRRPTP